MKKIQHYTEREVDAGLIRPEILDHIFVLGGDNGVLTVQSFMGGLGGGWELINAHRSKNRLQGYWDTERECFRQKIRFIIDSINGDEGAYRLEQVFKPRLPPEGK